LAEHDALSPNRGILASYFGAWIKDARTSIAPLFAAFGKVLIQGMNRLCLETMVMTV
jgi:hypothetical protein